MEPVLSLPGLTKEDRERKYRYIFDFVAKNSSGRRFSEIWEDAHKRHMHMGRRMLSRVLKRYCAIGFMEKDGLRYLAHPGAQILSSKDRSLHYILKDAGPDEAISGGDLWAKDQPQVQVNDLRAIIQPELSKLYLKYVSFLPDLLAKPSRQAAREALNQFTKQSVDSTFSRISNILWSSRANVSRSKLEVLYREDSFPFRDIKFEKR